MQIQKTVFISYRRKNMYMARAVYDDLHKRGYDVYLDIETGESGDFSQTILQQIDARAHFLLILTPSALERCTHPDDWLRREIEYAMERQRNIIPLRFENFKFEEVQHFMVSDRLKLLPSYNSVKVDDEYFEAAMDRLRSPNFLNRPIELVLHPASPAVKQAAAEAEAQVAAAPEVTPEQQEAERLFESGYRKSRLLGDYTEAIADLTRVIELRPDDAEAYHWRGLARFNIGDHEGIFSDLKTALHLNLDDLRAPIIRSMIAKQEGDLDLALFEAEIGVHQNPNDSEAFHRRGYVRDEKGDFDGAIADYTEAIRLNPKFGLAYNNRGIARRKKGDIDRAIADYTEAIHLNPQFVMAYYNRGLAFEKKGDKTRAIADYKAALRINPHHISARKGLDRVKKSK
ncbi:MAG: tetratricopeptide repeat protein [Anaerolineae bacterium]|nr:tetratricopeptide repeat protein [Anaerolineae bacterium]